MAMHSYGCRVIQRLIEHCTQQQMVPILDEVIQHVLSHGRVQDKKRIIAVVKLNVQTLSGKKCASNVVEKCFEIASHETDLVGEREGLMLSVLGQPGDPTPPLHTMMRDKYGNYIVQRMIKFSQDKERKMLVDSLKAQIHTLKRFTHGKHVISALAPYLEEGDPDAAAALEAAAEGEDESP